MGALVERTSLVRQSARHEVPQTARVLRLGKDHEFLEIAVVVGAQRTQRQDPRAIGGQNHHLTMCDEGNGEAARILRHAVAMRKGIAREHTKDCCYTKRARSHRSNRSPNPRYGG